MNDPDPDRLMDEADAEPWVIDLNDGSWTIFDPPIRTMWPGGGPPSDDRGQVTQEDVDRALSRADGDVVMRAPDGDALVFVPPASRWPEDLAARGWTVAHPVERTGD